MKRRVAVATRKGLFTVLKKDGGWQIGRIAFEGDNCTAVLCDARDGFVYCAIDHGHFGVKLHRSRSKGEAWEEIPAPAYPAPAEDAPPWTDPFGRTIPQTLQKVWVLAAGHPRRLGELWCGTMPGGLFRSTDHGGSWTLVRSLWDHELRARWFGGGADWPGIHSICQHPADPDRLLVAVSCGGLWETTDGAATWRCIGEGWRAEYLPPGEAADPAVQDVHRVVQCPAAPEVLWIQHHNGIFRSTDGGHTLTEIRDVAPSAFGFTVAVHPRDPDTAWFVPAVKDEKRYPVDGKLVVTRTRNGGRRFKALAKGLPRKHAYDLVYRHALDVNATGEILAMGSTTGSLWISEDQGTSWQAVSHHLPPVYAVAFAK